MKRSVQRMVARSIAMNEFFQRLKKRKLVQWTLAYVAAAFALLQGIDIVAQQFGWPESVRRGITLALVLGFFVTLVLAWYHGERGAQRITGTELVILALLLGVGSTLLWRVARPAPGILAATTAPFQALTVPDKSIAVLPFDNLSRDPENAYFSEGIQDEILTRLAKIAELKVISRTSTQRFKSSPEDLRQIAQQLGVAHILEGSVQKSGNQVRVNVQLIKAATDAHLWADTYDRKLIDIFAVESEIAKTVAETLQAKLTGAAAHVLVSAPTENPEAHQLYLKGRYFWNKRGTENLRKAITYFEQAIALDPHYALAYAGLGDAHALMPIYAGSPAKEDVPQALAAGRKAVELDDKLAEAHTCLANALVFNVQYAAAEPEFRRAIELNPNYATAHQWLGESLQATGRYAEAVMELQRARELDPLSPIINASLASTLETAGRLGEAIKQVQQTIDLDPNLTPAHEVFGMILEDSGRLQEAMVEYEKALKLDPRPAIFAMVASVAARTGAPARARQILADLTKSSAQPYALAVIHAALGEKEEALRYLEQSLDERSILPQGAFGSPKIDKRLDPLRDDPRFQKLLARFEAGIPE